MDRNPATGFNPETFRTAMQGAVKNMQHVLDNLRRSAEKRRAARTPEQIDRMSEARLRQHIRDEREQGRIFVIAQAQRVRRELGLPPR